MSLAPLVGVHEPSFIRIASAAQRAALVARPAGSLPSSPLVGSLPSSPLVGARSLGGSKAAGEEDEAAAAMRAALDAGGGGGLCDAAAVSKS